MDGMTDAQYKGMLLDELENWRRVLSQAEEENAKKTTDIAREQIEKITEKLKF